MQIPISSLKSDDEFQANLHRARAKGATAFVEPRGNSVYIIVRSNVIYNGNYRLLGTFDFEIDEDTCTLARKRIVEKEYRPLEIALFALAKYLKKKKIKTIAWD